MATLHNAHSKVFILHENPEWIPPFAAAFQRAGVDFQEWIFSDDAGHAFDLDREPPQGVFWSRLSASSHTRGHAHAKEHARAVLAWLERHGRRVVNGAAVLEFEVSKVRQYLALQKHGFNVPRTSAVFGKNALIATARQYAVPFIVKHNQGGKGLGVRRFDDVEDFERYVNGADFEAPVDGITLIQEYIPSREHFITRLEFIGGKFHYAVRVDTSAGSFQLCPADACRIDDMPELAGGACDIQGAKNNAFSLRTDVDAGLPFVQKLEAFLQQHQIEVAGVEFIETPTGERVIYDINTNTNYNAQVEAQAKQAAADRIVAFLDGL